MRELKSIDAGALLGTGATGYTVPVWSEAGEHTPQAQSDFYMPDWGKSLLLYWASLPNQPVYIYGPSGSGKTSGVKQVAASLNYEVWECTGHSRLEFPELVGHHTVNNGSMTYEYGPLTQAMQNGGIFLLNEADLIDPGTAAGLNSILDGSPLLIAENGGEIIKPHPAFRFVATGNTNGGRDTTGMYQGTLRQNAAFIDRFLMVEADYLSEEHEVALLRARLPAEVADFTIESMVTFARSMRAGEEGLQGITTPVTTRSLLSWGHLVAVLSKTGHTDAIKAGLVATIAAKATPGAKAAILEYGQRLFGYDL